MKHEREQLELLEAEHALVSAQRGYEISRAIVADSEELVRHAEKSLVFYRGLALHDVQDVDKAGERLKQVKARLG